MSKKKYDKFDDENDYEYEDNHRKTWVGYYERKTKTKREKEIQQHRKDKQRTAYMED